MPAFTARVRKITEQPPFFLAKSGEKVRGYAYLEMKAPKLIQINYSSAVLPRGYIFGKGVHFAGRFNPGCFCFMEVAA